MSDRVFTEGFPERWSMVHRDDCTLLVRRGDMGMFITPSQAICMAPKLMQGEAWLGTAKEIAHAMAGSREQELNRIFDEFCDSCGIGPPHDEQDRPQSNIRSVRTWTCDRCDHVNDRPKHRENPPPAPILRGYQERVAAAHHALFHDDPTDVAERVARFFEEAVETCQAFGLTHYDADKLLNYTYDRPVGEPHKEIGAAMLTLTSLCVVAGYDLAACGEADLEKLLRPETIARIRAKRATRHGRGPLPGFDPTASSEGSTDE